MPFTQPTLQNLVDRITQDFTNRVTGANVPLLRTSALRVIARVFGGVAYLMYGYLSWIKNQLFASTADQENLLIHGSEYGITQKAATYSSGIFLASGVAGTTIPAGTQLTSPDGKIFIVSLGVIVGAAGTVSVSIIAQISGTAGNEYPSTVLTFSTPIAGVNSTGVVDSNGISGGTDQEDIEILRGRILDRKRQNPQGGASFDYVKWMKEIPGNTRAWAIPQYNGPGTVGVAFVRDTDPGGIIANPTELAYAYSYLLSHTDPASGNLVGVPVTATAGVFMITLTLYSVPFSISIYPNTSAIQTAILSQLSSLLLTYGGPGQTIYYNDIITAIRGAGGLIAFRMNTPIADIGISVNLMPVIGTVTFGNY